MNLADEIRAASLPEPHERTVERLVEMCEESVRLREENAKLRKRGDKYYSIVEDLGGQMHDLRETVRWYGAFVESVKDACLLAQGVKKNAPLGGREIADRGFRNTKEGRTD